MHSFLFSRSDVKISAVHVAAESEVCLVQFFFGVQFFKTKLLPFTEIMKIELMRQQHKEVCERTLSQEELPQVEKTGFTAQPIFTRPHTHWATFVY